VIVDGLVERVLFFFFHCPSQASSFLSNHLMALKGSRRPEDVLTETRVVEVYRRVVLGPSEEGLILFQRVSVFSKLAIRLCEFAKCFVELLIRGYIICGLSCWVERYFIFVSAVKNSK
jgi:hypothetical protein